MLDEFTESMFEEFSISPQKEICLKAFCVWDSLDWDASEEEITKVSELYGLTYKQAMKWKMYWIKYMKVKPKDLDR